MSSAGPDELSRDVRWEGIANARDLGGILLADGDAVAVGRIFRSAKPDRLTAIGADALRASGVRTIVDLRSEWEREPAEIGGVTIVHRPVEDVDDVEFMTEWRAHLGGPAYYAAAIRRWPDRVAAAIAAVADAPDGGVLLHCSAGRDRTGMLVALLLSAAGAPEDGILDDYEIAMRSIREHYAGIPDSPEDPQTDDEFDARLAGNRAALSAFLAERDAVLAEAGIDPDLLRRAAARLVPDGRDAAA